MKFGTEVVIKGGKVLWGTVPPTKGGIGCFWSLWQKRSASLSRRVYNIKVVVYVLIWLPNLVLSIVHDHKDRPMSGYRNIL